MTFKASQHLPSLLIAFVFIQSLVFKFSGSYETNYIFSTLGAWSGLGWFAVYGGYLIGTAELIASILLFSRWHGLGALMSVGIMSGAIFFHLFTPLGIVMPEFNQVGEVVGNDSGLLFAMACLVWLCAAFLVRRDLKNGDGLLHQWLNKGV
ncbi:MULTISPECIES: hypothetical protein [Vibrio]|uniref:hypothetical protein n=1 Tax=Vibrio TaxID=662 RepID=UPI000B53B84C|nr:MULTISPECIES: hypothetical protein [Vibrio]ASG04578.1 hypothetical protein CEJ46_12285 [Vibrio anguillarum]MCR9422621.1 hypothetical protein [Vibrio sp. RM-69-4]